MGRIKHLFLRKLKASSLTEVVVATSILLIVFAIALVTLNNMMLSTVQKDTHKMELALEKLIYQYKNSQLKIPTSYKEDDFLISVEKLNQKNSSFVEFSITHTISKKKLVKKQIFYETP